MTLSIVNKEIIYAIGTEETMMQNEDLKNNFYSFNDDAVENGHISSNDDVVIEEEHFVFPDCDDDEKYKRLIQEKVQQGQPESEDILLGCYIQHTPVIPSSSAK